MPISAAALRAMAAAGATVDMIIAAVEAQEVADRQRTIERAEAEREKLVRKRALEAARQQRKRDRDQLSEAHHASSRVTQRDERDSPANGVDLFDVSEGAVTRDECSIISPSPSSSSPPTPPIITTPPPPGGGGGGGGGDARAHDAEPISQRAHALARQVETTLKIDPEFVPPGWCGLTKYLESGLAKGWRPELVLLAVQKVAATRIRSGAGPPETFGYLTKPILREHAQHQNELTLISTIATRPEQAHGANRSRSPASGRSGGIVAAARQRLAELAEAERLQADRSGAGEGGDGGGDRPLRVVSA